MPGNQVRGRRSNVTPQSRLVLRGKLDALLEAGATEAVEMTVWRYDGSEDAETEETIEVWPWQFETGQSLAAESECIAFRDNGRWYIAERPTVLRGKLTGTLSPGGSAEMTVWRSDAATSETVTVHDWMLKSGQTIASGKKVVATYFPDSKRWYVTAAECG